MKALRTFTCCAAAITALVLTCSQAAADFATPFVETTPVGGTSKEYGYLVSLGPQGTHFLVVVATDQMEHLVLQAVAEKGVVEDSVLGKRAVIQAQVLKKELGEGRGRVDVKLKITRVWSDAERPNDGPKGRTSGKEGPMFSVGASRMFRDPEFSEGLSVKEGPIAAGVAPVAKGTDSALGYIDRAGKWVIPPRFRQAGNFSNGIARVQDADGQPYYYIDRTGKRAPEELVKRLEPVLKLLQKNREGRGFREGLAVAAGKVATSGSDANKTKWGFIDHSGKFVIQPQYDETYDFSEGLAKVHNEFKFGFIDHTGRVVIPLQFGNATVFSEGLAAVRPSKKQAQAAGIPLDALGRVPWGYIDRTGKFVIPPQFSLAARFSEGLAYVHGQGIDGFIDRTRTLVIDIAKLRDENGDK